MTCASVQTHTHTHTCRASISCEVSTPHFSPSSLDHLTKLHHLFLMRKVIDEKGISPERIGDTVGIFWAHGLYMVYVQYLCTGIRAQLMVGFVACFVEQKGSSKCWIMQQLFFCMFINKHELTSTVTRYCVCVCVWEGHTLKVMHVAAALFSVGCD